MDEQEVFHADYILCNGTVLTQNADREVIRNGCVVIGGGKLCYVGAEGAAGRVFQGERIDCTGCYILPGLIDGHGHAGHPMTKHIGCDALPFWGKSIRNIYFFHTTPEFWYYDGQISAIERLKFGVTTGMNVIANEPRIDSLEFAESHIQGYGQIGARTIVAVGPGANNWPKPLARLENGEMKRTTATWEQYMRNTEELLQRRHMDGGGRVRIFVTPYTIVPSIPTWGRTPPEYTAKLTDFDRQQLKAVKTLAGKYHTGIHSDAFGNGIEMMAQSEYALLGENVLLQHCYDLSNREVELLARTGTHVGHSAEQSSRFCPFSEMLAMGVNAIVTSDGNGPRVTFDMFEHMRRCQDLEQIRFQDFSCVNAQTLLDSVTINSARALGMEQVIGSLEPGKDADCIVVKVPGEDCSDPVERCVYEASGRDCRDVFVQGEPVVRGGEVVRVEEAVVLSKANRLALEVFDRAGVARYASQRPVFGTAYQTFTGESFDI